MKLAILIIAIMVVCLAALAFLGGVHHSRFTRYRPDSAALVQTESDFKPSLSPGFARSTAPHHQEVIPYLYYRNAEPDKDPHIYLNTTDRTSQHGYHDKHSVVVASLSVRGASGTEFRLITPAAPRTFSLEDSGYGERCEDLGPVAGDVLFITATGYVVTGTGDKKQFSHSRTWQATSSTRTDLGLFFTE